MTSKLILIAGPVRSGTHGDEKRIHENLSRMEQAALAVYQKGHIPMIGEWLAFPLASAAGSKKIGDEISESFLYPVAHRLITRCDAVFRIEGESNGADNDVRIATELGLAVYHCLEAIPDNGVTPQ
ncbi:NUDIX hydrolase [Jejubacter calystegiae]|uniref:NUDIX hydrolase n=1 Tax=Jejubacter calystegiae TaxID=2579935 RepID=A0A4P8YM54_9ENTR|nr:NUDIX hydrolase [Jejubacter calystegiae]QCT21925.1 NUDIX hydrolase [Jejubacter calystegiae]